MVGGILKLAVDYSRIIAASEPRWWRWPRRRLECLGEHLLLGRKYVLTDCNGNHQEEYATTEEMKLTRNPNRSR
jgi:hypothetical protein